MGITDEHLTALVDEGLGNSAYLVDLGDGRALAVDASRDVRALRAAIAQRGLRVAFAADTHLHADFLSGAVQLAHDDGATVLASAAGARAFGHVGLVDGDEVDLGGLALRALATPGHTDEHLSYLLRDGERELGVFTGGSLIVGSAARTDLLGPDRTEELARAQYRSVHRLAALPEDTAVWPTHGAGSFCAAPPGAPRTSTIGTERTGNALLNAPDEESFVRSLLAELGSYPEYFDRLGARNRAGPALLPAPVDLAPLPVGEVRRLLGEGAQLVDARPVEQFASGHVPGAVSIPLRPAFGTWLGWMLAPEVPVVIVLGPGQDATEVAWQAAKIGHDGLVGQLTGGMDAWRADGGDVRTLQLVTADRIGERPVLDVRQQAEYAAGHIPGAAGAELGDLTGLPETPPPGTVVMCGHGERAATAASLLSSTGVEDLAVLVGGPDDWAAATGEALQEDR